MDIKRRQTLATLAAGTASLALPRFALAQGAPVRLGVLIPLTGSTSQFGASMGKAAAAAADEINTAGGINGRKVELVVEDDQSNPEAAVRAARKLIDVDHVVAICGTYASSVTSAVAPLCWESKTMLMTASGADSITALPHHGYIVRTSPTSSLQGSRIAAFAMEQGAKKLAFVAPQTPFSQLYIDVITAAAKHSGAQATGLIYEDKKGSYRSEVDRVLKFQPDAILFGGYVPDTSVVMKDLYRAGYNKLRAGLAFGVNQKLVEALPADISEGAWALTPSASVNSQAYKRLIAKLKVDALDPYSCQVFDHIHLAALALAMSKSEPSGTSIRDNIRKIARYDGASSPCEFADNGDVKGVFFRYEQIEGGKLVTRKIA